MEPQTTVPAKLFDWIVNEKSVRGSRQGDKGNWQYDSARPVAFNPVSRVVRLSDGKEFLIAKDTICGVGDLAKQSERILASLSNR